MLRLSNPIRRYDWGSRTAIPAFLGVPPDGEPQAELWIGAHPDAPSTLPDGTRLDDAVREQPEELLGAAVRSRFGDRLPYLVKVLAAQRPLSVQVHPDAAQAAAGFADEEERGVPREAPHRRYRDPHHKPEMLLPLEPFEALCGLRPPAAARESVDAVRGSAPGWRELHRHLGQAEAGAAFRDALGYLLGGDHDVVELVADLASAQDRSDPNVATAAELARAFPGDPGAVLALLLHRVSLRRGDALFLPPGNLHAYLRGTAVEVMACSDNVLRAGLTSKHVDPAEVLRVADPFPRPVPRVAPSVDGPLTTYRAGVAEFEVVRVDTPEEASAQIPLAGPRILVGLQGELEATTEAGSAGERIARGEAALVAAAEGALTLRGPGSAVVVGVASVTPDGGPPGKG